MRGSARSLLRKMLGEEADFHKGQWESIESLLNRKKTLVVQRTGWGKSIVYFITTKLLREQGIGPTLLISPLLSLMRNQIDNAKKIGISAETINSDNQTEWERVEKALFKGKCDILLLSPERLGNEDFINRVLPSIQGGLGLFVVDEAHCISDWGHDFRPDYRRIVRIVHNLPPNVPVLATTATANQRVITDINEQLGDLQIIRGPLARESLRLQVIKLADQAERLAWLCENIPKIEGSGIVYCLTVADCNKVAKWLRKNGINALEYHAKLSKNEEEKRSLREEREHMLMQNQVKVLVATVALGMGYDKPDLAFVIHYQRPGSLVEYYQQIGRAGRSLDRAYAILLNGAEDDEIKEYFIKRAFPSQNDLKKVVDLIEGSENGLKQAEILKELNMSQGRLRKCLDFLRIDQVIVKEGSIYFRTTHPWVLDLERSKRVTEQRYQELDRIREFVDTDQCYMRFITEELDDQTATDCRRCSNCLGEPFFSEKVDPVLKYEAIEFLRKDFLMLEPRKRWPAGVVGASAKNILEDEQTKPCRILCTYGDAGWGKYVKEDKYQNATFRIGLVEASVSLIRDEWKMDSRPQWVTFVPSLRHPYLVKEFAQKIAEKLGLPFHEVIFKVKDTPEQKTMENSYMQCKNAFEGFRVNEKCPAGPVLLIDDLIDSRWTMAVCGALLRKSGVAEVYPFALASTATWEGG